MDALCDYDSEGSDENASHPRDSLPPVQSTNPVIAVTATQPIDPVRKRARQSYHALQAPPTEEFCKNMVLWSKDYLTAKLDEAGRLTADSATQESSSTIRINLKQ
jgi:hypothetical protein